MSMFSIEVLGDKETARYLRTSAATLPARVNPVIAHFAEVLRMGIIAHASGRPGPNIDTGFYHESWYVEFTMGAGGFLEAVVGSTAAYSARLEYGFIGYDSLGRYYEQPPFPHIGPATDIVVPLFEEAMGKAILP